MSYYSFIGPCPSCGGDKRYSWRHSSCLGSISINEDCELKCNNCLRNNFIMNWKFECEKHWGDPMRPNGFQLIDAISHVCRNSGIPDYVRKKMINILNNY